MSECTCRFGQVAEGKSAVSALRNVIREWVVVLSRDVPNFRARDYDRREPVPDDVIASGHRLREFVRGLSIDGGPLPYAERLDAAVATALEAAEKEWGEAQDQLAAQQAQQAEVRAAAYALNRELVALRRSLALSLGTHHRDYRALRTAPASSRSADVLDEEPEVEIVDDALAAELRAAEATSTSSGDGGHPASNGSNGTSNGSNGIHIAAQEVNA